MHEDEIVKYLHVAIYLQWAWHPLGCDLYGCSLHANLWQIPGRRVASGGKKVLASRPGDRLQAPKRWLEGSSEVSLLVDVVEKSRAVPGLPGSIQPPGPSIFPKRTPMGMLIIGVWEMSLRCGKGAT